ncbi:uncharacterized protein [Miscanthus floridulus]|uniref:uncharacterized protein n=1 Tax=Miscanthus floridulus TaxID=154761 RepID=UPI00345A1C42
MSLSATGSDAGLLSSTSALSGAGGATTKSSSGIEVETPGLQGVVSRCSFGSTISRGTDSKGGVLRRFEIWTMNEDFDRLYLTEFVELLEEVKEDFGVCFKMPPPRMIQYRDLFERAWGWERFFPVYNPRYLEEFYWRNVKASGAQSETTLGRQPTICATAGVNLVYLGCEKVIGSTQSDATTGQQHANSACANHNLACADHNLSDATTGQHHANSACANHDLACADHNLAIADHNLAIILVYLCCKKEAELVSEWKKQRLQYSQKKQKKKNSQKKQKQKTKGLRLLSPEIRLSTSIQKEIISLVLPTEKTPIPIIPPVIYDCINCIMKGAELILEWLRLGFGPYGLHHDLSHGIRNRVFCLIKKYSRADPCSASVATCAVLLGITKESGLVCKKLRQDNDILGGENTLSLDIRRSALDMLAFGMDEYVLKRARIDGFCYRIHFDPASADILTWHEKEWQHSKAQDTELGKVHVDELIKENLATKNKLEEDVTVNGITRGSHELRKIIRQETSWKRM